MKGALGIGTTADKETELHEPWLRDEALKVHYAEFAPLDAPVRARAAYEPISSMDRETRAHFAEDLRESIAFLKSAFGKAAQGRP